MKPSEVLETELGPNQSVMAGINTLVACSGEGSRRRRPSARDRLRDRLKVEPAGAGHRHAGDASPHLCWPTSVTEISVILSRTRIAENLRPLRFLRDCASL